MKELLFVVACIVTVLYVLLVIYCGARLIDVSTDYKPTTINIAISVVTLICVLIPGAYVLALNCNL